MTIDLARQYLKRNKRYIKITKIAADCKIDKNMISRFIAGKSALKPAQRVRLIRAIGHLQH